MEIKGLDTLTESLAPREKAAGTGFQDMLAQGIQELNQMQHKAADMGNRLAAGEDLELHEVMIAAQEADIALRLATQVRNQALEAYREIMRMPV